MERNPCKEGRRERQWAGIVSQSAIDRGLWPVQSDRGKGCGGQYSRTEARVVAKMVGQRQGLWPVQSDRGKGCGKYSRTEARVVASIVRQRQGLWLV